MSEEDYDREYFNWSYLDKDKTDAIDNDILFDKFRNDINIEMREK